MSSQVTPNINNEFFKGLYKQVWRKEIPSGLTEAEVDFIEEIGQLKSGSHVLDLMCGYGRHTLELARRGYNVTAIDSAQEYISEITEFTKKENLSVTAFTGDVSEISVTDKYDMVLNMGNSFAFFDAETAYQLLQKIYSILNPGGIFIINTWMIGEIASKHFQEKEWHYIDEYKFIAESKYLFNPTRIESNYTILSPSGEIETLQGIDYIFSFSELNTMLSNAGFRMTDVYSTPRKRKYKFGDNRAYIVAVRS